VNDSGDIDLIFKVEEKPVQQFTASVSYNARDKFVGTLSLIMPNFRGQGEYLGISFSKGERVTNASLAYTKPWLFDTPLILGGRIFYDVREYMGYRKTERGGAINLGRPIPKLVYTKGFLDYSLTKTKLESQDDTTDKWRSKIVFTLKRDSRDNPINATAGTYTMLRHVLSGGPLGGEVHFHKYVFETSFYNKLWKELAVMSLVKIGWVGKLPRGEVPPDELFSMGGVTQWGLRGYRDYSIGPHVSGSLYGGKFAFIYTFELKWVIKQEEMQTIYPLVFFDVGNVWKDIHSVDFTDLYSGAGIGIRVEIPMMGLIGIDYAYRFRTNDLNPKRKWELHFQMGRRF